MTLWLFFQILEIFKMKYILFLFLFLFISTYSYSQNLVMNPSFEGDTNIICQRGGFEDGDVPYWSQLYSGDYFTKKCCCPLKYKSPRSGYGFVGIYTASNYIVPGTGIRYSAREYLIGKLSEPLLPNIQYNVSFWVKPSNNIYEAIESWTSSNISLAFVKDTAEIRLSNIQEYSLRKLPEHITNDKGDIMEYVDYTKVEGCYKAQGGEKYIVIGNFRNDSFTTLVPLTTKSISFNNLAFFLIDDVMVEKVSNFEEIKDTNKCADESLFLKVNDTLYKNITLNNRFIGSPEFLQINTSGQYVLEAGEGNCKVRKTFEVSDYLCKECNFFIPNVFTPNGDNINDDLSINSSCDILKIESEIFNRWGALVAKSSNTTIWDGMISSQVAPPGVYVYHIQVFIQREHKIKTYDLTGDITLLK